MIGAKSRPGFGRHHTVDRAGVISAVHHIRSLACVVSQYQAEKEAGKTGEVAVLTNGGGNQMACDNVKSGAFDKVWSYDVPGQARDMVDMIKVMFQSNIKPGGMRVALYTPLKVITMDAFDPSICWSLKK